MADVFGSNYANALNAINGVSDRYAQRQAGASLAGGDYGGAANTMFRSGDLKSGLAIQDQGVQAQGRAASAQSNEQAQQLDFTLKAVRALKGVKAKGGNVLEAYQSFAPVFQQMGADPQQIAQIGGQLQADPDFLDKIEQIVGQEQQKLNFQKAGDNLLVFEGNNPDPVRTYEPPPKPIIVGGVALDPTTHEPIFDSRETKYVTTRNSDGTTTATPVGGPQAGPVSGAGPSVDEMEQAVLSIPGTVVTSGARSAEHNASIPGSVSNSYHIPTANAPTGLARDFRIPQGQNADQFAALVKRQVGPGWQVIPEPNAKGGAHVHVEPAPRSASTPGVIQGVDNGPSPAEVRADQRFAQSQARMDATEARNAEKDVTALRKEFNNLPEVKNFKTVASSYENLKSAFAKPSAAGDISGIFAYMKILDPTSVVREGEFATAQNAAGVPDQVRNAWNKAISGQRLNERQRQDFITTAGGIHDAQLRRYNQAASQYQDEARQQGIDPSRVIRNEGGSAPTASAAQPAAKPARLAPALWATASPPQQQYWSANPPTGTLGGKANPIRVNPTDPRGSYANVPKGSYFLTPYGEVRGPKP